MSLSEYAGTHFRFKSCFLLQRLIDMKKMARGSEISVCPQVVLILIFTFSSYFQHTGSADGILIQADSAIVF